MKQVDIEEPYVPVRLDFQSTITVNHSIDLWVPVTMCCEVESQTEKGITLLAAVELASRKRLAVQADLDWIDTFSLRQPMQVIDAEKEGPPTLRCVKAKNGECVLIESGNSGLIKAPSERTGKRKENT